MEYSLRNRLRIHKIIFLLLAGLGVLVQLALLWDGISNPYQQWTILSSYPAVKGSISLDVYSQYTLALRSLVVFTFWIGAFVVYQKAKIMRFKAGWYLWIVSLAMVFIPIPFVLDGINNDLSASRLLGSVLSVLGQVFTWLGILLFLCLAYILPDGLFKPRLLVWIFLGLLIGFSVLLFMPIFDMEQDWSWMAMIILLSVILITGTGSQIYRQWSLKNREERRQYRGVFYALLAQPFVLLGNVVFGDTAWGGILNLHLQLAVLVLLPASILNAILKRGLWLSDGHPGFKLRRKWTIGIGLFITTALVLTFQLAQSIHSERLNFDPLPASSNPKSVIIDTDMAPDDWMAILYLLQRPDIEVQAITVSGTGEVHCSPGVRNVLGLVKLAGHDGIPAACGSEIPLEGNHVFPEDLRVRADTMNGMSLPLVEDPMNRIEAVKLLVDTVLASPEKVTLLALGPLTNLANAIQHSPSFLENIETIVIMGGALEVLGNVGFFGIDNQVAEWNFYIDPVAVKIVLESGAPVTLVPLDATNDVPINLDFYYYLKANRRTPEAKFVYELLTDQLDFIASGGYYFWDPLAAAMVVDQDLGYVKEGLVRVFTAEGQSSGMTRLRTDGDSVRYAVSADAAHFYLEFLRTLNQP